VSDQLLQRVAERLRTMGNPLRLRILHLLEDRELTVSQIVRSVPTTQANVSKHLTALRAAGLVAGRRDGVNVYYRISDPIVFVICRTMCDAILRRASSEAAALARTARSPERRGLPRGSGRAEQGTRGI
jgi:DNA-binding transcriptional ArsR family regulator